MSKNFIKEQLGQTEVIIQFDIEPKAIQSCRFANGRAYQPKDVILWKRHIYIEACAKRGKDFKMLENAIEIEVDFVFTPPKAMAKKVFKQIADGVVVYKTTKPDLTDNLMKGFIDALSGVIWERDQQIAIVKSRKIYGEQSGIKLIAKEIL